MSKVFWCDYTNHAAKLSDDMITMSRPAKTMTITDQFGSHVGQMPAEEIDICHDCAVLSGLVTDDVEAVPPEKRHAAITAAIKGGK